MPSEALPDQPTRVAPDPTGLAAVDAPPVEDRLLNRELSWLAFNERVLEEALDGRNPLLERLRFLTIFHANLDEFFMVRVSGLKQQVDAGVEIRSSDGLSPSAQLTLVRDRVEGALRHALRGWERALRPQLAEHGVSLIRYADLDDAEKEAWDRWYLEQVHPILTPLAVGPTLPFPFISNLSLNLALWLEDDTSGEQRLARVKIPLRNVPRLLVVGGPTPSGSVEALRGRSPPIRLLPVEALISANLHTLFPGVRTGPAFAFRVTRDADFEIREVEADDLLGTLQQELRRRRFGHAIRLEVEAGMAPDMRETLRTNLDLDASDTYETEGLLAVDQLVEICGLDLPQLRYPPLVPARKGLAGEDLFGVVRAGDVLLHHPFDAFTTVVDFVGSAARDPSVVAMKQTLYRTSGNSPIIDALEVAIEDHKQVAAVVELKARFDEENNIVWAQRLERSGVHVIYGVPHLKTHAKLALVVRREEDGFLRRYVHLGTGNYNPTTARVYTDLGLFTADPDITADVADLFNVITGSARPAAFRALLVAPRFMKHQLLGLIAAEAEAARAGLPARMVLKCNAITHPEIIRGLYDASRAGVEIELLVRGICNLVPGVPGMSDRIRVRSVVGRFLEHSRVFWFHGRGAPKVYIGSADLMERNLDRRVEVLAPVRDPALVRWLGDTLLARYLADRGRTREMAPDGSYSRPEGFEEGPDVHQQFLADLGQP